MIEESTKLHNKPVADSPLTLAEVTGFMAMEVKLQSSLTEQNAKFIKVWPLFFKQKVWSCLVCDHKHHTGHSSLPLKRLCRGFLSNYLKQIAIWIFEILLG